MARVRLRKAALAVAQGRSPTVSIRRHTRCARPPSCCPKARTSRRRRRRSPRPSRTTPARQYDRAARQGRHVIAAITPDPSRSCRSPNWRKRIGGKHFAGEIVRAVLGRINVRQRVNAWGFVDADGAPRAARIRSAIDGSYAQRSADGIPAGIKDDIGSPHANRYGTRLSSDKPARYDAPAVARLLSTAPLSSASPPCLSSAGRRSATAR